MIQYQCKGCGAWLEAPTSLAGEMEVCAECGTAYRIPGGEPNNVPSGANGITAPTPDSVTPTRPKRSSGRQTTGWVHAHWRLIVLWVGVGLIVLMCMVPPWTVHYAPGRWDFQGYDVLWTDKSDWETIDTRRLWVQCIAMATGTLGVVGAPWLNRKLGGEGSKPKSDS